MHEPTDHLGLGLRHEDRPPPRDPRRVRRAAVAAVIPIVLILVLAVALVGSVRHALSRFVAGAPDYSGDGYGSVVVVVQPGDSLTEIGRRLDAAGVVHSVQAFTDAASSNNKAGLIGPGYYRLHLHMKASLALQLLLNPAALVAARVPVPEGFSLAQTLARLARETHVPLAQLKAVAAHPAALHLPAACGGQLEGCLYPATYTFSPNSSATQVLGALVARTSQELSTLGFNAAAAAAHRSPFEVLIVASLVQREAKLPADYPKVAAVIYNRLRTGMPLQLDSTVVYALGGGITQVTTQDTKVSSPYNTYLHVGLPPTPIDSPGAFALSAALSPSSGSWLYFVTVDKAGHTQFTSSYQQFLQLKAEATRNGLT